MQLILIEKKLKYSLSMYHITTTTVVSAAIISAAVENGKER